MRKPSRALVATVTLPFLASCMGTIVQPLPEPSARPATPIRGVILVEQNGEQRIEYSTIEHVEWSDSTLALTGIVSGTGGRGSAPMTTVTYRLDDVSAILVRELDANRTSLFVGGMFVGLAVLAMLLFTGQTDDRTVF